MRNKLLNWYQLIFWSKEKRQREADIQLFVGNGMSEDAAREFRAKY